MSLNHVVLLIILALLKSATAAFTLEMVTVGDTGNPNDITGYGNVDYEYKIGKFPVTIGQYSAFLNSVAAADDTYKLYDTLMATNTNVAGIARNGSAGSYTYSAINNSGNSTNRPIGFITWFRAARFANWVSNGQPVGPQNSQTTEDGAYTLNGAMSGNAKAINPINPNTGQAPLYYITRENEWYKAAFYNGKGGYYLYATQNNTEPGNLISSLPNQANYITLPNGYMCTTQDPNLLTTINYLTDVGAFTGSPSNYGTFDQNGNVWEWCETNDLVAYRISRGGGWTSYSWYMASTYRLANPTAAVSYNGGLRLASPVGNAIVYPSPKPAPSPSPTPAPPSPPPPPPTPMSERIAIDMVAVGNVNNIADPATLFGSVSYEYKIGKYMVTIGQYCAFLNAVAKQNDTYALYNIKMAEDLNIAGIMRSGSPGSYSYTVMDNGGNSTTKPISYVSFFDAARFANWMSNGQPKGAQDSTTTEAGAYPLYGALSGIVPAKVSINPNTGKAPTYYISTESEWYKSGFYSPTLSNGTGGYYPYATQSTTLPGNVVGDAPNQANFIYTNGYYSVIQSPTYSLSQNYLTNAGAFTNSPSYYNTFDQNGNLWEWNDGDGLASSSKGNRGGFWAGGPSSLSTTTFSYVIATHENNDVGFRVVSPGSVENQCSLSSNGLYRFESQACPGKYLAFSLDCARTDVSLRTNAQSKPPRTQWTVDIDGERVIAAGRVSCKAKNLTVTGNVRLAVSGHIKLVGCDNDVVQIGVEKMLVGYSAHCERVVVRRVGESDMNTKWKVHQVFL